MLITLLNNSESMVDRVLLRDWTLFLKKSSLKSFISPPS